MADRLQRGLTSAALLVALASLTYGCKPSESDRSLTVYVAASMSDVVDSLSANFVRKNPGTDVVHNVASTSLLGRQIELGAQADIYFAADTSWTNHLEKGGHLQQSEVLPVSNALIVIEPEAAEASPGSDMRDRLRTLDRIALADPSHVPAGQYAKQALECLGIWTSLEKKIVPSADVRAAAVSAVLRSADAAIVYQSDLTALTEYSVRAVAIDEECQPGISLGVGLVSRQRDNSTAQRYLDYVVSPDASVVWESFGFVVD